MVIEHDRFPDLVEDGSWKTTYTLTLAFSSSDFYMHVHLTLMV